MHSERRRRVNFDALRQMDFPRAARCGNQLITMGPFSLSIVIFKHFCCLKAPHTNYIACVCMVRSCFFVCFYYSLENGTCLSKKVPVLLCLGSILNDNS